jgi:hypothetical protein
MAPELYPNGARLLADGANARFEDALPVCRAVAMRAGDATSTPHHETDQHHARI